MKKPPVAASPALDSVFCAECGAENKLPAQKCWLCYRPLSGAHDVITAEVVGQPPPRPHDGMSQFVFGGMTLGSFALVLLVGASLATNEADLLMPVAIVILPAVIATAVSLFRSSRTEQGTNWQRAFFTMLASFGITMGILALLAVALFVTLFAMCINEISRH